MATKKRSRLVRHQRPRWHRRKQARPAEIIAAALEVFVERGYAATKLEDVARRAGVTKGTMYLYFESKEALFKAVVREALVPVLERGEQLIAEHQGSTRDLMVALLRGWWELIGCSRVSGIPKLMMAEASNFPELTRFYLDEVVHRGHALMARALRRGIDRGEFRPLNPSLVVRIAIAPLLLSTIWKHSFGVCESQPFDPRELLETHIDIFLRGIATDGA